MWSVDSRPPDNILHCPCQPFTASKIDPKPPLGNSSPHPLGPGPGSDLYSLYCSSDTTVVFQQRIGSCGENRQFFPDHCESVVRASVPIAADVVSQTRQYGLFRTLQVNDRDDP